MGKYSRLGDFLKAQRAKEVPLSFAEIERIIGGKLPPNSPQYPAWWSNNPSNNVMTKVWLEAGFKTEQVDIEGRKLVFRRTREDWTQGTENPKFPRPGAAKDHPLYGALKGTVRIMPG